MEGTLFSFQILSALLALFACYALALTFVKEKHMPVLRRSLAIFALVTSAFSLLLGYTWFFTSESIWVLVAAVLLAVGTILCVGIVAVHRFALHHRGYKHALYVTRVKYLTYAAFIVFLLHILTECTLIGN